jgi:hypothetical protein
MVFFQFAERVRLPMIVLLDRDGKVDAPVTVGMKSSAADYKAEIRARLNKLLAVSATGAKTTQVERAEPVTANALTATLSQKERE